MAEQSIPDRFVYTWGEIQRMPEYDGEDSRRYAMHLLKQTAMEIVESALMRALAIADAGRQIDSDSVTKP